MQKIVPRARSKNGAKEIAENGEWEFQSFTYEETYDPELNLTKIIYTLRFRKKISVFSFVHYHADRHSGCSKLFDFSDSSRVWREDTILFDLILDLHGIFDPV